MWIPIFYLALNALVLLYFWRRKKTLSSYEIAGCWLVATIFGDDWLTIASDNLHLIQTSKVVSLGFVLSLNRILLFRVVAVLFLDEYVKRQTAWQKIVVFLSWTIVFLLLQLMSEKLGLFRSTGWSLWWSIPLWMLQNGLLIGLRHVFARLTWLAKEGR